MALYDVYRADGSVTRVEASSKSEASRKVRYAGEMIKRVVEVTDATPPAETTTPTPTPTEPTPTEPTPTEPTPTTTEYADWSHLATFKERLEQQVEAYNKKEGTSFSLDKAGITKYLDKIGANERTRSSILNNYDTATQLWDSFQDYLTKYQEMGTPEAKDFSHYLANFEQWYGDYQSGLTEDERARVREYEAWWRYARKYGADDDQYPVDIDDFYDNPDIYQQQLTSWKSMAEETEVEYTDEQQREWASIKDFIGYREPSEEYPLDIEDYFANPDKWQGMIATWQQRYEEREAEGLKEEEYTQWSREQTKYAAEERYRETPMYGETFSAWLGQQGQFSGALEKYTESQYPSLRSRFEAGMPRQTGFPTREEARSEAARRETGFAAWLGGETPGIYQKYMSQRPAERGERLWMQAPNVRGLNW